MAMVVQHNLTSMNANRQLGITTGLQAKSSEKLASGYRVNRAGDDAAGLKISEKMRNQVRGLQKASSNTQDGISLIQTAEGAMNEAHSILQRMSELAVQGANDTNQDIDRDAINKELEALTDELDRIASTTQFNKQNLLDGTFQDKNLHVGANSNQKISISIDNLNARTLGLRTIKGHQVEKPQTGVSAGKFVYQGISSNTAYIATDSYGKNLSRAIGEMKTKINAKANDNQYAPVWSSDGKKMVYKSDDPNDSTEYTAASLAKKHDVTYMAQELSKALTQDGKRYLQTEDKTASKPTVVKGADEFELGAPNVNSYEKANATLEAVQNAINDVSTRRSALGALQNRLEHTVANLDNVAENTQAAESRIRDTDMASEMVTYSKNNILAQAGQSMLAQANQSNQGVLSLLG